MIPVRRIASKGQKSARNLSADFYVEGIQIIWRRQWQKTWREKSCFQPLERQEKKIQRSEENTVKPPKNIMHLPDSEAAWAWEEMVWLRAHIVFGSPGLPSTSEAKCISPYSTGDTCTYTVVKLHRNSGTDDGNFEVKFAVKAVI